MIFDIKQNLNGSKKKFSGPFFSFVLKNRLWILLLFVLAFISIFYFKKDNLSLEGSTVNNFSDQKAQLINNPLYISENTPQEKHYNKVVESLEKNESKKNIKVVFGKTKLSEYYPTKQLKSDKTQVDIKKDSLILVSSGGLDGDLTISDIDNVVASIKNRDTEIIAPTVVKDAPSTAVVGEPGLENVNKLFQTIKVGSYTAKLSASDDSFFQISFLVPEANIGDNLIIFRSQDGQSWEGNNPDIDCILDNSKYCTFKTNHLTYFSVGTNVGTVFINNDAKSTNSTGVTLNTDFPSATYMKFGNTPAERDAASRIAYNSTYSWQLTDGNGIKTVYAMFTDGVSTGYGMDTIKLVVGWDNDNFIDENFWALNPTTGMIIDALYGDGSGGVDSTAYTQDWTGALSNVCTVSSMNVVYVGNFDMSGLNSIPTAPVANTIYLLTGGRYINSLAINLGSKNCVAIISSMPGNTTMYSSVQISSNGSIYASAAAKNHIIDGVKINGTENGSGATHTANSFGVYFSTTNVAFNTINNVDIYRNSSFGLYVYNASRGHTISNSRFYNNPNGILLGGSNNIVKNSEMFNNTSYGLNINGGTGNIVSYSKAYNNIGGGFGVSVDNNVFDNLLSYNNSSYGFGLGGNYNSINNCQSYNNNANGYNFGAFSSGVINNSVAYNNKNDGFSFSSNSKNNLINNISSYSNNGNGLLFSNSTGNVIYGSNDFFLNLSGNTSENYSGSYTIGGSEMVAFGRSDGSINNLTDTMNCSFTTNSVSDQNVLLFGNGENCDYRSKINAWSSSGYAKSIFPTSISKQQKSLYYQSTSLSFLDVYYNTGLAIGDDGNGLAGGYISFLPDGGYTNTTSVQIKLELSKTGNYIISGDIVGGPIVGLLNGSGTFDVDLTAGYGIKRVYTYLYDGTGNYVILSDRIKYASSSTISSETSLIGDYYNLGTDYNYLWNLNSCDTGDMIVDYYEPGLYSLPLNFGEKNTLYFLNSGNYLNTGTLFIKNSCIGLVGSGDVSIYTTGFVSNSLYLENRNNIILDNIKFIGTGVIGYIHTGNTNGLYLANYANSNTFNNIIVTRFVTNGISINSSDNNYILNSQTYSDGSAGLALNTSKNNVISGHLSTGNSYGININANENIFNQVTLRNNTTYGFYIAGTGNIVNKATLISNNSYGWYIQNGRYNQINDSEAYSNSTAFGISHSNTNYSGNNIISNCVASGNTNGVIISVGEENIISGGIFRNNTAIGVRVDTSYNIIKNLKSHNNASYGIRINAGSYNVIDNVKSFNNSSYGLEITLAGNNTITNSQFYNNNPGGISLANGALTNNIVDNCQTYNNVNYGIMNNGPYNTINNTQSYNNRSYGILFSAGGSGIMNNSQIYNNPVGIQINNSSNNKINDVRVYNNNSGLQILLSSTGNIVYGNLDLNSLAIDFSIDATSSLLTGGSEMAAFGRSDGSINYLNDAVGCYNVSNPLNSDGIFLLNYNSTCRYLSDIPSWSSTTGHKYAFGYDNMKQNQSLRYSGTILTGSNISYDSDMYIGETIDNSIPMGTVKFEPNDGYTTTQNVVAKITVSKDAEYTIIGDIVGGPINGSISGSGTVNLTLSAGYGIKTVYAIFSTGGYSYPSFDNIKYTTTSTRDVEKSIISSYYDSGYYTNNWQSSVCNTGEMLIEYLNPGTETIPRLFTDNYILEITGSIGNIMYILNPGDYIVSESIHINNDCVSIIGSGLTTIYSDKQISGLTGIIYINSSINNIIDNLTINNLSDGIGGTHTANLYGVNLNNYSYNNTLSNIDSTRASTAGLSIYNYSNYNSFLDNEVYNNGYGTYIGASSQYNVVKGLEAYSNQYGIYLAIAATNSNHNLLDNNIYSNTAGGIYVGSTYNEINNSQIYNNTGVGIYMIGSYNVVNNNQIYNNITGVYVGAVYNVINNSQIYNNTNGYYGTYGSGIINNSIFYNNLQHGILFNGTTAGYNKINNVRIYNNSTGLSMISSTGNKIYGNLNLFANNSGIYQNAASKISLGGSEMSSLGWNDGSIDYTSSGISCDYVTNPINISLSLLLPDILDCNIRGRQIAWNSGALYYMVGFDIPNQIVPVEYQNITLVSSDLSYASGLDIADYNSVAYGKMYINPDGYTTGTSIQVNLILSKTGTYILSGDILEANTTGTIIDSGTFDVTLTPGYGIKNIYVYLLNGDDEYYLLSKTLKYVDNTTYLEEQDIVNMYYGSGSTYIQNWNINNCDSSEIIIKNIDPGSAKLPSVLDINTIYLLNSGYYDFPDYIEILGNCTAVVGSGDVTLYTTGVTYTGIILVSNSNNLIFDNIIVNGSGIEPYVHTLNGYGIKFDRSSNNTINNIKISNTAYGLFFSGSTYNTIDNSLLYSLIKFDYSNNNFLLNSILYGENLWLSYSNYNTINNIQAYNDSQINIYRSSYNSINNAQVYNNTNGIYINYSSNYNVINNSQIYNNTEYGINITTSSGNVLNDVQIYNNGRGLIISDSPNNKYYGTIKVFDNKIDDILFWYTSSNFIGGTDEFSSLGWTDGELITGGYMNCKLSTNIIYSGKYFNNISLQDCNHNSYMKFNYYVYDYTWYNLLPNQNISYIYGKNIIKQIAPVYVSGSNLIFFDTNYNTGSYIGETDLSQRNPMGYISVYPNVGYTTSPNISLKLEVTDSMVYVITGDIEESGLSSVLNDSGTVNVTLTSGYGIKNIYVRFYTGSYNYPVSFDRIKYVDTDTMNYEKSIIGNYFNKGSEYTDYWKTISCNTGDMLVQYVDPGVDTVPLLVDNNYTLGITGIIGNTIYILNSGDYIFSDTNYIGNNCTAIIGSGTVNLYTNQLVDGGIITPLVNRYYVVYDNLNLDGMYDGSGSYHNKNRYGFVINGTQSNISIHNSKVSNFSYGIYLRSEFLTLNSCQIYNNINYGIFLEGDKNFINNSQIYNNGTGIMFWGTEYSSLNNSQIYNNGGYGAWLHVGSRNSINNTIFYNNGSDGLFFEYYSQYNQINNVSSYNNKRYGIRSDGTSSLNKYFGNIITFGNGLGDSYANIGNGNLIFYNTIGWITGTLIFYNTIGWITGTLITGDISMDCGYATNPMNVSGNFLHSVTGDCNMSGGSDILSWNKNINYMFGSGVMKQNRPVFYTGYSTYTNYITGTQFSNVYYNTSMYVAEDDLVPAYISYDPTESTTGSVTGTYTQPSYVDISRFSLINNSLNIDYLFTGNGIFDFIYSDSILNTTGIVRANVTWISDGNIDSDPPIINPSFPSSGDNTFDTGWLTLIWDADDGTGVGISGYYYQIADDLLFSNIIFSGFVDTTGVSLSNLDNSKYYWRVRGLDLSGNTSDYVTGDMFKIFDAEAYLLSLSYLKGTGSVKTIDANTFVGNNTIDVSFINDLRGTSEFTRQVILKSTGDASIEISIPNNTYFKTDGGSTDYTGNLYSPIFVNTGVAVNISSGEVHVAIRVGNIGESVLLQNDVGGSINSTITVPVSGMNIGDTVTIYYSNDDITWENLSSVVVIDIGGNPYVEFQTNHFTDFAIVTEQGAWTGSFVINNDTAYTLTSSVVLPLDAVGATNVRFRNEADSRSEWFVYTTSYNWILSAGYGTKTVYAQIDMDSDLSGDIITSDNISYLQSEPGTVEGNLWLVILTGASECVYGTSLNLGSQNIKLNESYSFSGLFSGEWYCADYKGYTEGWTFTMQMSGHLTNNGGSIISGNNVYIYHDPVVLQGDNSCTGGNGVMTEIYTNPYTIFEKTASIDKICRVSTTNVGLQINVPANQAPGDYIGTLVINIPNFY